MCEEKDETSPVEWSANNYRRLLVFMVGGEKRVETLVERSCMNGAAEARANNQRAEETTKRKYNERTCVKNMA